MTSLDQENLRRTQAERRIAMQNAESGGAGWMIGIVVVVAVIAGIFLFGGSGDGTAPTATPVTEEVAPAATDEAAPATTVTE